MAILIRICVFLMMLFGIYDTKAWKPDIYSKGENVTILQINRTQNLEMTFSGFTSKQHTTNVMIHDSRKNLTSININYTGRITWIEMDNGSLSFFLLNVNFMDSGNYTVSTLEGPVEKGKKRILVPRTVIRGQDSGSLSVQFMCNKTNASSIKIEMVSPTYHLIAIYDVEQALCSVHLYTSGIESCALSGNVFFISFKKVSWYDFGTYVVWDDKSFLLDSVIINIEEGTSTTSLETTKGYATIPSTANTKQYDFTSRSHVQGDNANVIIDEFEPNGSWSSEGNVSGYSRMLFVTNVMLNDPQKNQHDRGSVNINYTDKPILLFVSAVAVVVVAACLVMIAFQKIRHRRVPTSATNDMTFRNRRNTISNSFRTLYQNVKEAILSEDTRMVSAKNNGIVNLKDKSNNKDQVKDRQKEENIYHRRFDYADSSTKTTRNFQISSVAHLYDYIHENQDHCWSYESSLRSSPNSTESISEPCCEYDYVVQHSFMTLRPPAPDPVVTGKTKDQGTRADSISWYKRLNIKVASRVDPLTLYSEIHKERSRESNCTASSSEPGSSDFINQLAPSSYFELESIRATDIMNSPSWLTYSVGPNWRKVENLNSKNCVLRSEFSEIRDKSKTRRVGKILNYDYPRRYFDHPSAMYRRHRRSQSLSDMMAIASIRWPKRRSARSYMKKDCYDSL